MAIVGRTFPLRGIKDWPPYLHDDRLLTLDDTVEFFNPILSLKLTECEKKDLVAYSIQFLSSKTTKVKTAASTSGPPENGPDCSTF
jgi:cytochrome c peroxidase